MAVLGVTIRAENLQKVAQAMGKLADRDVKLALARALTDTGYQAQRAVRADMGSVFDRPTPFITRNVRVFHATPEQLRVAVAPTLTTDHSVFQRGGKVGVDPQDVLQAQEYGGKRRDKRSEVVLRRAGWLPDGYQTVIPRDPFPGSEDQYGNLKGPFLRSVLSYLQAFQSGQGHQQNMSAAKRALVNKYGKASMTKAAQQQAGPYMGRRYFIAGGRAAVTWDNRKYRAGASATRHLQPGIWAALGSGKSQQLKPVLMFVKAPTYKPRLDMQGIIKRSGSQEYLDRRVRFRIRQAAGM